MHFLQPSDFMRSVARAYDTCTPEGSSGSGSDMCAGNMSGMLPVRQPFGKSKENGSSVGRSSLNWPRHRASGVQASDGAHARDRDAAGKYSFPHTACARAHQTRATLPKNWRQRTRCAQMRFGWGCICTFLFTLVHRISCKHAYCPLVVTPTRYPPLHQATDSGSVWDGIPTCSPIRFTRQQGSRCVATRPTP